MRRTRFWGVLAILSSTLWGCSGDAITGPPEQAIAVVTIGSNCEYPEARDTPSDTVTLAAECDGAGAGAPPRTCYQYYGLCSWDRDVYAAIQQIGFRCPSIADDLEDLWNLGSLYHDNYLPGETPDGVYFIAYTADHDSPRSGWIGVTIYDSDLMFSLAHEWAHWNYGKGNITDAQADNIAAGCV